MRDLNKVFREAMIHPNSVRIETPTTLSYVFAGIKAERNNETGEVVIYNTKRGGDFYREISDIEYRMMMMFGFNIGACNIAIMNAKRSLRKVQEQIMEEVTGRNNKKRYEYLKQHRVTLINNYNKWKYLKD